MKKSSNHREMWNKCLTLLDERRIIRRRNLADGVDGLDFDGD